MHLHEQKKDFTPLVFKNKASHGKWGYIDAMYHVIHKDWNDFMEHFMHSSFDWLLKNSQVYTYQLKKCCLCSRRALILKIGILSVLKNEMCY